ncbi:MAG TPA: DUF1559 domain-containing protein, partial [Planctomycetota bacterium]|nr:DUF1559 domain-containing protein [Planctomycetota bacterium]
MTDRDKRALLWFRILLYFVVLVFFLRWLFPGLFMGQVGDAARRTSCMNNVRQIGLAMDQYAGLNGGRYPDSVAILLHESYLTT